FITNLRVLSCISIGSVKWQKSKESQDHKRPGNPMDAAGLIGLGRHAGRLPTASSPKPALSDLGKRWSSRPRAFVSAMTLIWLGRNLQNRKSQRLLGIQEMQARFNILRAVPRYIP